MPSLLSKKMEIFSHPFPFSYTHTHHSHIRRSFPLKFFMWRATVFYFHTPSWSTHESQGEGGQSSGLPNVYSTVLENNFGKWPNGVDITTQMSCVSVKRIGKQARSPSRRKGNVNTSSSVKWVVSVYDTGKWGLSWLRREYASVCGVDTPCTI